MSAPARGTSPPPPTDLDQDRSPTEAEPADRPADDRHRSDGQILISRVALVA